MEALGKIGPDAKTAIPVLTQGLKDRVWHVRCSAALALGGIGPTPGPPFRFSRSWSEAVGVRCRRPSATLLFRTLTNSFGLRPQTPSGRLARRQFQRSSKCSRTKSGRLAAPHSTRSGISAPRLRPRSRLFGAAEGRPGRGQQVAAQTLGAIDSAGLPSLGGAFRSTDRGVRQGTFLAAEKTGPAAIPVFVELLKDEDFCVRQCAAGALGRMGPKAKEAIPALMELLKDKLWIVQETAATALGEIRTGPNVAIPVLTELLKDKQWQVRATAANVLGRMGPAAKGVSPASRTCSRMQWRFVAPQR